MTKQNLLFFSRPPVVHCFLLSTIKRPTTTTSRLLISASSIHRFTSSAFRFRFRFRFPYNTHSSFKMSSEITHETIKGMCTTTVIYLLFIQCPSPTEKTNLASRLFYPTSPGWLVVYAHHHHHRYHSLCLKKWELVSLHFENERDSGKLNSFTIV